MPADYDIAIVGAGPAGTACALALRHAGRRVLLLDKAEFPRDKICGDAIPGHALKALRRLDPSYTAALGQLEPRDDVRRSRLVSPAGHRLTLAWKLPTFNSPRLNFDAALLDLVRTHTATEIQEGATLKEVEITAENVRLRLATGPEITARLVIGCDGANSAVARKLLPAPLDRAHHIAGVRAYYENVAGVETGLTEFFLSSDHLAGYLWVFPVGNGVCNVGLGMLAETVAAHRLDLRQLLPRQLATHPALAGRFAQARMLGPVQGFGLPIGGGRVRPISGGRFMLCGDAASLIDPLQGHGIDTAIESGVLAAGQAIRCFESQDFSALKMQEYEAEIAHRIGRKLAKSYRLMRFLSIRPGLVNAAVWLGNVLGLKGLVQRGIG